MAKKASRWRAPLSANHGEMVHQWGVDGRAILLRSYWDVRDNLESGKLVHILADYRQQANIWAVYAAPLATSANIRVTVEFFPILQRPPRDPAKERLDE